MQDSSSSHGLWVVTAPPAPETKHLAEAARTDVAIVGAGFTGLSAALHLAERGVRAVVLEASEIGHGGSGRNVGLVNAGMWVMPDDLPTVLGSDYGNRLLDLLGSAPDSVFGLIEKHGIACDPERAGTLHCAVGARGVRELEERAAQWRARGAPVRLLGAEETAAKVGSRAFPAALLDARAGTIQPLGYARGLADAALAAGARIYTKSPMTGIERDGERWRLATPDGSVTADWVIAATNAYTTSPWPELRAELVHLPYFNFATAPLPEAMLERILPERQGAWDTNAVLTSFRLDKAGRLIFGSVGALHGTGRAVHRAFSERALRRLFPQLGPVSFETAWYGMIGLTADNLPRFHRLAPNVIAFSGYNGRGIAPGTVFGQTLAGLIAGEVSEDDLPLPVTPPQPARLRALREQVYSLGSQAVHLVRTIV